MAKRDYVNGVYVHDDSDYDAVTGMYIPEPDCSEIPAATTVKVWAR